MKRLVVYLVLSLCLFRCYGQIADKSDTQAYEMYLTKTFAQYYPLPLLQRIYNYLSTYSQNSNTKNRYVFNNDSMGRDYLGGWVSADCSSEGPIMCYTDTYQIGKEQGFHTSHRHYDDRVFPDSLRFVFKQGYAEFRTNYPKKSIAQKNLIEALTAFSKTAHNKPLFFAVNSYTTGLSPAVMEYMLKTTLVPRFGGVTSCDEIGLPVSATGGVVPCGATAIWEE